MVHEEEIISVFNKYNKYVESLKEPICSAFRQEYAKKIFNKTEVFDSTKYNHYETMLDILKAIQIDLDYIFEIYKEKDLHPENIHFLLKHIDNVSSKNIKMNENSNFNEIEKKIDLFKEFIHNHKSELWK